MFCFYGDVFVALYETREICWDDGVDDWDLDYGRGEIAPGGAGGGYVYVDCGGVRCCGCEGPVDGDVDAVVGAVGTACESCVWCYFDVGSDGGGGPLTARGAAGEDVDPAGFRTVRVHWGELEGVAGVVVPGVVAGYTGVCAFGTYADVSCEGGFEGLDVGEGWEGVAHGLLPVAVVERAMP